jgi:hypothetical protein
MQTGNGLRSALTSAIRNDAQTSSKVAPIRIVSLPSQNRGTAPRTVSHTVPRTAAQKNETSNKVTPAKFVNPFASLRQSAPRQSAPMQSGGAKNKNKKNSLVKKEVSVGPKDKKRKEKVGKVGKVVVGDSKDKKRKEKVGKVGKVGKVAVGDSKDKKKVTRNSKQSRRQED